MLRGLRFETSLVGGAQKTAVLLRGDLPGERASDNSAADSSAVLVAMGGRGG